MMPPIALLTPMANPTVEREMRAMLPPECHYVVGRLVGPEGDSTMRLRHYAEELPRMLDQFGGLELSAIAFACTASSYLIGQAREREIAGRLNLPVLWAAAAIRDTLNASGATRVAVISPYPEPIHRAGLVYWAESGLEIAFEARVEIDSPDTRGIYALNWTEARADIDRALSAQPDAVLLSGTGMPTAALTDPGRSPPILSSNLCLARAMIALTEPNP